MRVPPPRVVLALVVALVVAAAGVAVVRAASDHDSASRQSTATTTSSTATSTTTSTSASTSTPSTTAALPPATAQVLAQIKDQVASLRGLPWVAPLDIQVLGNADFVKALTSIQQRDLHPDRMNGDSDTLKVLKLIPNNLDYIKAYNDLLSGAVLGLYDSKTTKLYIRSGTGSLTPYQRITVSHEMDHALTDQHFKFGPYSDQLDAADKQEQGAALSGLLEGDAKTLEAQWAQTYLSAAQRQQANSEIGTGGSDVYNRTPKFILDSLFFPYTTGKAFVQTRYRAGGWAAVNAAYQRWPDSTQVIFHPEEYAAGKEWSLPPMPDVATATSCTPVRTGTLGEFTMVEMLEQHLDSGTSETASDDWNGDAFATVRCGSARGFADRWVAPDANGAGQLASALASWVGDWSGGHTSPAADGRFSGPSGAGRVVVKGAQVDLVLADDAPTSDKVSAALGD